VRDAGNRYAIPFTRDIWAAVGMQMLPSVEQKAFGMAEQLKAGSGGQRAGTAGSFQGRGHRAPRRSLRICGQRRAQILELHHHPRQGPRDVHVRKNQKWIADNGVQLVTYDDIYPGKK
jgi:hypothetical protein